jgi:hypothetical protein
MRTLKLVALYFFAYAFAKKMWEYDLASQVIDGVNEDGGIFLAQARTIKDLAFFNPTIFTAPYGFPQQFSYLFTDSFLIPGIIFSILTLFGLTEQLALNLIKITGSILNGFVSYFFFKPFAKNPLLLSVIFQTVGFQFVRDQVQLQFYFVFPLALIILRSDSALKPFFLGACLSLSYFLSAYYFVFLSIILGCILLWQFSLKNLQKLNVRNFSLFLLGLAPALPFLFVQASIAAQRKREILELALYTFNLKGLILGVFNPDYLTEEFKFSNSYVGYVFLALVILALLKELRVWFLVFLLVLFLAELNLRSFASWILLLFLFTARDKLASGIFLLFLSCSLGSFSEPSSVLNVVTQLVPSLQTIRVPVRYFFVGSLVFFLLSAGRFSFKKLSLVVFSLLLLELSIYPARKFDFYQRAKPPELGKVYFALPLQKMKLDQPLEELSRPFWNTLHMLALSQPGIYLYNLHSGYYFYKHDAVERYLKNFPDEKSLRVLKSLLVDYVAIFKGTLKSSSSSLNYASSDGLYDYYSLGAVTFDQKGLFFIPPYAQYFLISWKADNNCFVNVRVQGRELKVKLEEHYTTYLIELNFAFSKVNPWEFWFESDDCKITVKETEFYRSEKEVDVKAIKKLAFDSDEEEILLDFPLLN